MPFTVLDPALAAAAPASTAGQPATSGSKNLAELRTFVKLGLGNRDDLTPDQLRDWINESYLDLVASLRLAELQGSLTLSLVSGQALYLLPAGVDTILGLAVVDSSLPEGGVPLSKTDQSAYREWENASGRPRRFFRLGQMLVVYPTPDKAYTAALDFRIGVTELSLDTHVPILAKHWHEVLGWGARVKALLSLGEYDKALVAENYFNKLVERRKDREADENENRIVVSSVPHREPSWMALYEPDNL